MECCGILFSEPVDTGVLFSSARRVRIFRCFYRIFCPKVLASLSTTFL